MKSFYIIIVGFLNIFKNQFKKDTIYIIIMSDTSNVDKQETFLGRVKWFNNRAGYGFIKLLDGENEGGDVFAHHSGIEVSDEQYKYLVQGEYVSFKMGESDSSTHPYQASDIRGVLGGVLMCETRNEQRQQQSEYDTDENRKPQTQSRGRGSNQRRGWKRDTRGKAKRQESSE